MKVFQGRTVLFLVVITMLVSSMLTLSLSEYFQSGKVPADQVTAGNKSDSGTSLPAGGEVRNEGLNATEIEKISTAYRMIASHFYQEISRQDIVDGAIRGMVAALDDPFTAYMNPDETNAFTESVDLTFSGIGAEVTLEQGKVTVIAPIKGSPAERAGIRANDVIVSVNGESLSGLTLNDAVMKIRGSKGSQAKLEINRNGSEKLIEVIVVRDDINMESIFSRMEDDHIGLIEIRQFVQNTDQRFAEELKSLQAQGLKGLVIDVRNNPGGYLYSVIDLLDQLLSDGDIIVQVENREGAREKNVAEGQGADFPIAVLVNQGSASASEILAAGLQENGVAKLFGEKTYGKGTVQTAYTQGFADGSNLKITIAKWLTPQGNFIHGEGIQPDIEVEMPDYFKVSSLPKDHILEVDQNSQDVKNLQIMLRSIGFPADRTDGYYSEQTKNAVQAFQQLQGIPASGKVDQETAESIEDQVIQLIQNPDHDSQLQAAIKYLRKNLGIGTKE